MQSCLKILNGRILELGTQYFNLCLDILNVIDQSSELNIQIRVINLWQPSFVSHFVATIFGHSFAVLITDSAKFGLATDMGYAVEIPKMALNTKAGSRLSLNDQPTMARNHYTLNLGPKAAHTCGHKIGTVTNPTRATSFVNVALSGRQF